MSLFSVGSGLKSRFQELEAGVFKIVYLQLLFTLSLFSYEIETEHFRVYSGKDESFFVNVADEVANYAEFTYAKETELFREPKYDDKIEIFLSNTGLTHPMIGEIDLSLNIAGFSALDENNQPFLVINPYLTDTRFKSILAHEFFHIIQFDYYDFRKKSTEWWAENLWWIESTAVWAEFLVYPEIESYVPFANYYVEHHCEDIRTVNLMSEYSKVLIPMYIDNPKLVAESFEKIDEFNGFVDFLNKKFGFSRLIFGMANREFEGVDSFEEGKCGKLGLYGFDISYNDVFTGANLLFDIFKYADRSVAVSKVQSLDNPLFYNEKDERYASSGWNYIVNLNEKEIEADAYVYEESQLVKRSKVKPLQGYWVYFDEAKKLEWNQININKFLNNSFGSLKIKASDLTKKYKNIVLWQYVDGWKRFEIKDGKIVDDKIEFIDPFLGILH